LFDENVFFEVFLTCFLSPILYELNPTLTLLNNGEGTGKLLFPLLGRGVEIWG
jgi:hypothetical protein